MPYYSPSTALLAQPIRKTNDSSADFRLPSMVVFKIKMARTQKEKARCLRAGALVCFSSPRGLVGHFINPLTYSAVLFRADDVARTSQIATDMVSARTLSARKTHRRLRQRINETTHLGGMNDNQDHYFILERKIQCRESGSSSLSISTLSQESARVQLFFDGRG